MDGWKKNFCLDFYFFFFINISIFTNVYKYVRRIDVVSKFQTLVPVTTVYLE